MEEVVKLFSIDAHFELLSYAQDERRVSGASRTSAEGFVDHL